MDFITVKEAAAKWRIGVRCVQNYCVHAKIPGAKCIGKQWLIPADANQPVDRRKRNAKNKASDYRYHFPVFIYSPYFSRTAELKEPERRLLAAQINHLEGRYSDSIVICRQLLEEGVPEYLAAGIWCTIGFASLLLGLYSEYENAVAMIEEITAREPDRREDYRLLSVSLRYHTDWNAKAVLDIDSEKLSPDAMIYYKYLLLMVGFLSGTTYSAASLQYISLDCMQMEQEGITPASMVFQSSVGVFRDPGYPEEIKKKHLDAAARIAVENGWIAQYAKFHSIDSEHTENSLRPYGAKYCNELKERYEITIRNWKYMKFCVTGDDRQSQFDQWQNELILLLINGLSYRQIADCSGRPYAEIKREIEEIKDIAGVDSKQELIRYGRDIYQRQE